MELIERVGEIAREAGSYVHELQKKHDLMVEEKGSSDDFVTEADYGSQNMIREYIARHYPQDRMIGEEDGISDEEIVRMIRSNPEDSRLWVVDPLDGTVNYIRGLLGYSISVGVFQGSVPVAGAIYQPDVKALYLAERNSGAQRNGRPIHVSRFDELSKCIGATHVPVNNMVRRAHTDRWNEAVCTHCQNLRMLGASTYEQVSIASGGLDFYYEIGPHPWDLAAGCLLVKEAGGAMSTLDGGEFNYGLGGIIISNGAIHSEVVRMLAEADPIMRELF